MQAAQGGARGVRERLSEEGEKGSHMPEGGAGEQARPWEGLGNLPRGRAPWWREGDVRPTPQKGRWPAFEGKANEPTQCLL